MSGLFDAGSYNCSTTGKIFNTALTIGSFGMVAGPSSKQCEAWKNPPKNEVPKPTASGGDTNAQIMAFINQYGVAIAGVLVLFLLMKK